MRRFAPQAYYVAVLLVCFAVAALWLPLWARAAYIAWIAVGGHAVASAEPSRRLPETLSGNVRFVARAHLWPLYAQR